jgi:hypothetical protein
MSDQTAIERVLAELAETTKFMRETGRLITKRRPCVTEHEIRVQIHAILDAHDQALAALRVARTRMDEAFRAQDDVLVSAIEANRAALTLLNRLMDEGVQPDAP